LIPSASSPLLSYSLAYDDDDDDDDELSALAAGRTRFLANAATATHMTSM
jgi:hypothetical protein